VNGIACPFTDIPNTLDCPIPTKQNKSKENEGSIKLAIGSEHQKG
jgi:hypothetical protein